MHFTVVFQSHESFDLSFSLVFIPAPVWKCGDREVVNLHRDHPGYDRGDLEPLLTSENIESRLAEGAKDVLIVVHQTGHGSESDLANLHQDLEEAGFAVREIRFGEQQT